MEIAEFEKKRAANLIWNGAQDYTIATGFRVYDLDGRADLYWNSIVGAIHLHYNWEKLKLFYNTFHETIDQGIYESLFWIALENAAFEKEKTIRPVFPYLRMQYAKRELPHIKPGINQNRADVILMGHLRRALGEDAGLPDLVDVKLLDALEMSGDLTTDEIIERLSRTLSTYFTYHEPGTKPEKKEKRHFNPLPLFFFRRRKKGALSEMGPVRRMAFGFGEHVDEYGSEVLDQSHLTVSYAKYAAQTDEGLKEYITNYFGKPILEESEIIKLQKKYCYGNHTDVKLFVTRGECTDDMLEKGFAGKMRKEAIEQAAKNEKAYHDKEQVHRIQVDRLTSRIRNSIMTHLDDQHVKSPTGALQGNRVWRALYLNDPKVFDKTILGDTGNITVDILLDASTSQVHRQEIVAAQGYMIAQSLTNCGIPVKVYSFCSMTGYTIVNLFRDYHETKKNQEIFRYFTTGANRDGLAIRLATGMLKDNHADHKVLIVLSDCKPNDVIKVKTSTGQFKDYAATVGVEDTAAEVHAARMNDITVLCVFTGDDDALPSVHRIYDKDFARIRSLDQFADTVGTMLQNRIRLL